MIERLLEFSLGQRAVVLLLTLLLVGLGLRALERLPIDAVPDVTNVQVQVNANAPGLSPPEVEKLITFPIEQAMMGLPDIEEVRSLSKYGLSQVTVVFAEHVDIFLARQLVLERLQVARSNIPADLAEPEMGPISTGLGEIYQYELVGDESWSSGELRALQDWFVKRQLLTVKGLTEVNSFGGVELQYEVIVDPERLRGFGLSLNDLFKALEENNRNAGAGFIEYRDEQYLVRGVGLVESIADIERIKITEHLGTPIRVGDVARVQKGAALRQGAVTRDGRGEAVTGIAMMLIGENSRVVAQRVGEKLDEIAGQLPEGVRIDTFYDRTELVDRTLRTVSRNLLEGALLVVFVLFTLLGDFRAALVVALAIPLSMLFAAILMVRFGISGNLMSLGAIDFGLVVDGSVVMVENAVRSSGSILEAVKEVGRPVVFGIAIIIVVYLPVMTLTGLEGKMFRPMAYTVVFALLGSLLLALTTIPVLASLTLRSHHHTRDPRLIEKARALYRPFLKKTLGTPVFIMGGALLFFLLSLVGLSRLGAEFLPELDEGAVAVQAIRLPSISLTASLETATAIEKALLEFREVKTVISKTGRPDIATDPMGVEISDIFVMLKPAGDWSYASKEALVEAMQERLEAIPGINYSFSQPIELRVEELISGVRSDVALKIFGDDLKLMREAAEKAAAALRTIPGASDVQVEQTTGLPYLQVVIDRDKVARYGINVSDIQDVLEIGLGERAAGQLYEGDRRFPIVVKLEPEFRARPESLARLPVPAGEHGTLPLGELADIRVESGLAQISREEAQRRIVIEANVRGRDLVGFVHEARAAVAEVLPPGTFPVWGGEFENYERARERLTLVVPLALILIFILLFAYSNSVEQSVLIFLNVPFAASGGIFALLLRGMPFSISAGVGFIALFGIAVLNGLVLLSAIGQRTNEGLSESVVEGSVERLRPVLMTALVAGLGFLPMALSHGAGAEVQRPLATVVIGGLVTSTLLTLLVLPACYHWWFARKRSGANEIGAS